MENKFSECKPAGTSRSMIRFCTFFALVWFVSSGNAASYYVSTSGDNSNPGTLEAPWAYMNAKQSSLSPGDVVYFRAGTYTNLTINTVAGTAVAPITYKGYPGEKPLIQSLTNQSAHAISVNKNYYVIDGFETSGGLAGIGLYQSAGTVVQNCDVGNTLSIGISVAFQGCTNNIVRNCRVFNASLVNWPREYGVNGWGGGISIANGAHGCLVENCVAYFIHGEGLLLGAVNDSTIKNCIVSDTFRTHLYANGGNNTLEGNVVWSTPENENDLNGGVLEASAEVTNEGMVSTHQYGAIGERGNRVINNLLISGGGTCLSVNVQDYYPTNYNWSDCLIANNTLIGFGSGLSLNDPYNTSNGFGNNFHIFNNLYFMPYQGTLISIKPVTGTNVMSLGNNLYVFTALGVSCRWNTWQDYFHTASTITNWMTYSGETNYGTTASVWLTTTNYVTNILANVFSAAAAMPRLWQTNGGPAPTLDIDYVFADLSTCSNKIVALRNQLSSPFRPMAATNNQAITTGKTLSSWTWVDDYDVEHTVSDPIAYDMLGTRRGVIPSVGALEPVYRYTHTHGSGTLGNSTR